MTKKHKRDSIVCKGYNKGCSETNRDEFEDCLRQGHENVGKFMYCNTCVKTCKGESWRIKDKKGTRLNKKKIVLMEKYRNHNTKYHVGDLTCTTCEETNITKFGKDKKTESGFKARCNLCSNASRNVKRKAKTLTIVGKIKFLLKDANNHNNTRNKLRQKLNVKNKDNPKYVKLLPLKFDIDFDYVLNLYEEQRKSCGVSGLDLEKYLYHPLFKMSLERIDDNVGYVKGNIVLICLCFNAGWNRSWTSHDGHTIVYKSVMEKTVGENPNDVDMLKVRKCPNSKCPEYDKKQDRRNCKCGSRIKSMYQSLKINIASRNNDDDKNPKITPSYPLTIDQVIWLIKKFKWKCELMGMSLSFEFGNNWTPSIDRIDNTKPHTMSNIRIVGCCMNAQKAAWTENAVQIAFKGMKSHTSEIMNEEYPYYKRSRLITDYIVDKIKDKNIRYY
jgi:hypothetical protein